MISWLADTNVLFRFINWSDPQHATIEAAVEALLAQGRRRYYAQQNRRELWSVCTRPQSANGYGFAIPQGLMVLAEIDGIFQRLPDTAAAGAEWDRLVVQHRAARRAVHDAQLVATLVAHGIDNTLTLDVADFKRFPEVTAIPPSEVLTSA